MAGSTPGEFDLLPSGDDSTDAQSALPRLGMRPGAYSSNAWHDDSYFPMDTSRIHGVGESEEFSKKIIPPSYDAKNFGESEPLTTMSLDITSFEDRHGATHHRGFNDGQLGSFETDYLESTDTGLFGHPTDMQDDPMHATEGHEMDVDILGETDPPTAADRAYGMNGAMNQLAATAPVNGPGAIYPPMPVEPAAPVHTFHRGPGRPRKRPLAHSEQIPKGPPKQPGRRGRPPGSSRKHGGSSSSASSAAAAAALQNPPPLQIQTRSREMPEYAAAHAHLPSNADVIVIPSQAMQSSAQANASWAPSTTRPILNKDTQIFIPQYLEIDEAQEQVELEEQRQKLEQRKARRSSTKGQNKPASSSNTDTNNNTVGVSTSAGETTSSGGDASGSAVPTSGATSWSVEEYANDSSFTYHRSELEHDEIVPAVPTAPNGATGEDDQGDGASTSGEDTDDEQFALRHYKREMNERIRWERLVKTPKFSKEDLELNDAQFLVSKWYATYSIADPVRPRRNDEEWEAYGRELATLYEARKAERAALAASQSRRRRESEMGSDDFAFVLGDIDDDEEDDDPLAISPMRIGLSGDFRRKRGRPPKHGGKGRSGYGSMASSGASYEEEEDYDGDELFDDELFQLGSERKRSTPSSAHRARQHRKSEFASPPAASGERSVLTHSTPVSTANRHKRRKPEDSFTFNPKQREQEEKLQRAYDSTFFWVSNREKKPPVDPDTKRPRNIIFLKKVNVLDLTSTMFLPPGLKPGQPWRIAEAEAEARLRAEEEALAARERMALATLHHPTPLAPPLGRVGASRLTVITNTSPSKDEQSHIDIENVSEEDDRVTNPIDPVVSVGLDPNFIMGGLLHDTKLGVSLADADINQDMHLDFSTMHHLIPTSDLHLDGDDLSL